MKRQLVEKIRRLRADPHMREVASGAVLAFSFKVVGAALAFAFNVAIARFLGADGSGLFFLALSITTIGSVIGRVGLDNTLLRFTATHSTTGEWEQVHGVNALGIRFAVVGSTVIMAIIFILAPFISSAIFDKPALTTPLRWMSLSILPFAVLNLQAESLKGIKKIREAMLTQSIGIPLFSLLTILPLAHYYGINGICSAYLLATVLMMLFSLWAWRRSVQSHHSAAPYPADKLWQSCKPLFVTSLMNRAILPWAPLFLLGIWSSTQEIGIYGAATRVAMLVSFMLVTVNNVLAPKFAELYARGDMDALGRMARNSALMITLLASPIFLVLVFWPGWVMSLFGHAFEQGATALTVLVLGQIVNTLTGSVNYLLMITGREHIVRNTTIFTAIAQIGLCLVLIPSFGSLGAAIATALSIATINLVAAYVVWKRLGIVTIPIITR